MEARCYKRLVLLTILLVLPEYTRAQSLSEHEKMIKQGLERLEEQTAPLRERPDVRLERPESKVTDFSKLEESDRCFDIETVNVRGVHSLPRQNIESVTEVFEQRCLGLPQINALVEAISNQYLEHGYITSRAYIEPQDLSDGRLELVVVEGVIEGISSVEGSLSERQLQWAFPGGTEDVLNIRALEHGIENLNSVGQNNAKVDLEPGAEQGGTLLAVTNEQARAWRGSLGLNNNGVPSTGEYQVDGNLVVDNLLGVNDTAFISASSNIGEHELPHAESRSYAASWSIPSGYWLLALNNNYYAYEQIVVGDSVDFEISGSSLNTGIQLGRNFYRSQSGKLDIALGFTRKDSKNYIEDIFLETSSRTLYVWDISADYLHFFQQGTLSVNAGVIKSVPWFGAKRQLVAAEDDFQFTKYRLNVGFNSNFSLAGRPFLYSGSAEYLYSPKVILASEGLSVGGRYSVRGLSESSLFGYKGGYIRNDVSMPTETSWRYLNRVHYFIGFDAGWSNLPEYADQDHDWVAGAAIGFRMFDRDYSFTFSYARALRVPDFLPQKQQEIDVSFRLNF